MVGEDLVVLLVYFIVVVLLLIGGAGYTGIRDIRIIVILLKLLY